MTDPLRLTDPFRREFTERRPADELRLQRIMQTPRAATRVPARRRRRWTVWIGSAVGATLIASGAYAVLRHETASDPTGIVCHDAADLDSNRILVPAGPDPVAACAEAWLDGTLSTDEAPPLVTCVNPAGLAAVVPGDDTTCGQLGLATFQPGHTAEQQAIADLHEAMAEAFTADCLRQDDALDAAQRMLDASGLTGWRVQLAEDFPPGFECGSATPVPDLDVVIVGGARPAP